MKKSQVKGPTDAVLQLPKVRQQRDPLVRRRESAIDYKAGRRYSEVEHQSLAELVAVPPSGNRLIPRRPETRYRYVRWSQRVAVPQKEEIPRRPEQPYSRRTVPIPVTHYRQVSGRPKRHRYVRRRRRIAVP